MQIGDVSTTVWCSVMDYKYALCRENLHGTAGGSRELINPAPPPLKVMDVEPSWLQRVCGSSVYLNWAHGLPVDEPKRLTLNNSPRSAHTWTSISYPDQPRDSLLILRSTQFTSYREGTAGSEFFLASLAGEGESTRYKLKQLPLHYWGWVLLV